MSTQTRAAKLKAKDRLGQQCPWSLVDKREARRQRNRDHAKVSRARKRENLWNMERELERLRELLKESLERQRQLEQQLAEEIDEKNLLEGTLDHVINEQVRHFPRFRDLEYSPDEIAVHD